MVGLILGRSPYRSICLRRARGDQWYRGRSVTVMTVSDGSQPPSSSARSSRTAPVIFAGRPISGGPVAPVVGGVPRVGLRSDVGVGVAPLAVVGLAAALGAGGAVAAVDHAFEAVVGDDAERAGGVGVGGAVAEPHVVH